MQFTDNFQFPCPDEEDYGAIALYLQRLALEIEAKLLAQMGSAENFEEQPTAIWRNLNVIGPIPTSGVASFGLSAADNVFYNFGVTAPAFNSLNGAFPEPGLYHVGFSVNTTEVGAVTADSFRQVVYRIERENPTGTFELVCDLSRRIQAESIAGGSFFGSMGTVQVDQQANLYTVQTEFSHTNVGSNVQVPVGGLLAWMTKIGTNDIIEVT